MTKRKINLVLKEIKAILGENNASVELREVTKNNGVVLHGVTIRFKDSSMIVPTLYIENYDEKKTSREIAKEIIADNAMALENSNEIAKIDPEIFMDFNGFVKSHICYRLVNKKANKELLKTVPHRDFLDLAIIYVVQITDEASMKVTFQNADIWNVTEQELFNLATENTPRLFPAYIRSMFDTMLEKMEIAREDAIALEIQNSGQIVVTNEQCLNGATTMLYPNVIENLYEKYGNFALLPSSINEVIIFPMNENIDPDELTQMVKEVNQQCVSMEEILSDHAYIYNGEWK